MYDDSDNLIGFNYDNGTTSADYYYGIDNFGNINYIYDNTGAIVTTYKYDAWGRVISTTGTLASTIGTINPYRYKTYYYDEETQLYYLQSRYYDAGVGRFVSADEPELLGVSGGVYSYNLYAYCEDDPVNNSDPWGCLYISNKKLVNIVSVVLLSVLVNPVAATFIVIGAYKLYTFIVAKAAILGAKIGALGGPILSFAIGGILTLVVGVSGWTIVDALLQGKGLYLGFKRTKWGYIYGIDFSAK